MRKVLTLMLMVVGVAFFGLSSCGKTQKVDKISGAGATFPANLYTSMFQEYYKATGIEVNYNAIGSGGGQTQIRNKTVDFGASDEPFSDSKADQFKAEMGTELIHIPTCLGAVTLVYNLGLPAGSQLKLDADTIAAIFMGQIKNWNDARIAALNPGISLPDKPIVVVHRSDSSGTTFVFTDFLAKASKNWRDIMGKGAKSLNWPVGKGGNGNPGVTSEVKNTDGAIGYVELSYAITSGLPYAAVRNKSGNFISPSIESVSLAANVEMPDHTRVSITDTDSPNGYPISSFTWLLLYKEQNYANRTKAEAQALVDLAWWMTHEGQKYTAPINYAPLPNNVVKKVENLLKSVTYDGKPVK